MAIWSGGSRVTEAAATEEAMAEAATTEGSPIWSGLAMAIWSGGSRAAEGSKKSGSTMLLLLYISILSSCSVIDKII
ncbi:uncharacterized protein HKW66_Vig0116610 [Vigna angularis]|uniref:Uncharacterized protein n=1 Tax=Phaseolus angularis TaxID=3914 RepID=A0A8T0JY77_PHAAN|nr:uncharacterized protein HKW66_Vig0116610 [Vigna angularis]